MTIKFVYASLVVIGNPGVAWTAGLEVGPESQGKPYLSLTDGGFRGGARACPP